MIFCTCECCTLLQSTSVIGACVVGQLGSAAYFTINWWCSLSIFTCACIGAHQSQGLSVSSDSAVTDKLGWAADFIISWWCFMSRMSQSATIRSKCLPHVFALMFCTSVFCTLFQSTSVTRLMCQVRWCSGWWAGICIIISNQLMMFLWAYSLVHALVFCTSERWNLGTYVAVVSMQISHKVYVIRFSSYWWSGMCSIMWSSSEDFLWERVSIINPHTQQM